MTAVLSAKLPPLVIREMFLEGRRYSGPQAQALGLVYHAIEGDEQGLEKAIQVAAKLGTKALPRNRRTISVLKTEMVRPYLGLLQGRPVGGEPRL